VTLPLAADVVDTLLDPWRSGIASRAFLEVALLGVAAGPLGCWVVLYRLSYSAESLAHALFPGLVIAALLGTPLVLGAAVGAVVAAPAIARAARLPAIGGDTAVAIVVTSLLGLGALLALAPASPRGVQDLMFGDVLALSSGELLLAGLLAAGMLGALRLVHARLLVVGFDRTAARAFGSSPTTADAILLLLVGAFTVVAVQALGNLLVLALLVGPAATARLLTWRLGTMMALATLIAVAAAAGGLYLSYYADTAGGASIAAVVVAAYVCVAAGSRLAAGAATA
jgi:ABC-type Mn2+/Zn2+ transport system permease subunit